MYPTMGIFCDFYYFTAPSTLNTTSKLTNIPVLESNNSNIRNYVYNMCHNLNDIKPI